MELPPEVDQLLLLHLLPPLGLLGLLHYLTDADIGLALVQVLHRRHILLLIYFPHLLSLEGGQLVQVDTLQVFVAGNQVQVGGANGASVFTLLHVLRGEGRDQFDLARKVRHCRLDHDIGQD